MAEENTGATGLRDRITQLVSEEHQLRSHPAPTDEDRERLRGLEVELDQCWDLLRQRRALSEAGMDPSDAEARPTREVEGYLQ
jgi:hypothetical protein